MKIHFTLILHIYFIHKIIGLCSDDFGLYCDTCDT